MSYLSRADQTDPTLSWTTESRTPSGARKGCPRPMDRKRDPYGTAGEEPSFLEALDDPIVRLVMARDGLEPDDVKARMTRMALALRNRASRKR